MSGLTLVQKIFNSRIQEIEILKSGHVLKSNDNLFSLDINSNLKEFHPFFEILEDIFEQEDQDYHFNTVQLETGNRILIVDIIINSGNKILNPSVIIFDQTEQYNDLQTITQQRNEVFINNFFEKQKTQKNHEEKILKNKFLNEIASELHKPVSSVAGLLNLFQRENLTYEQDALISTINTSVSHLNRLVTDVFDLSKAEVGTLKVDSQSFIFVDFVQSLKYIFENKFSQKGIQFNIITAERIPKSIIGDKTRLLQILINILENSYNTTETGFVTLHIEIDSFQTNKIGLNFIVKDSGVGIVANFLTDLKKYFNKSSTVRIDGVGLGLAVVKKIVNLLNGSVSVDSVLNSGTTFKVFLRFDLNVVNKQGSRLKESFTKINILTKQNVLIVDDNQINQLILMKLLVDHSGFYMDVATNGQVALDMIENQEYDLIFMDLHMPVLNGIETIKNIRQNPRKIISKTPIIVLTAVENANEIAICKKLKVSDIILKPFTPNVIYASIYNALSLK